MPETITYIISGLSQERVEEAFRAVGEGERLPEVDDIINRGDGVFEGLFDSLEKTVRNELTELLTKSLEQYEKEKLDKLVAVKKEAITSILETNGIEHSIIQEVLESGVIGVSEDGKHITIGVGDNKIVFNHIEKDFYIPYEDRLASVDVPIMGNKWISALKEVSMTLGSGEYEFGDYNLASDNATSTRYAHMSRSSMPSHIKEFAYYNNSSKFLSIIAQLLGKKLLRIHLYKFYDGVLSLVFTKSEGFFQTIEYQK